MTQIGTNKEGNKSGLNISEKIPNSRSNGTLSLIGDVEFAL